MCLWETTKNQPSMALFYLLKKFQVADILVKGNVLLVKDPNSGKCQLKGINKDITFNEDKNQKEECDSELWKAAFDYISQNVEYNNEIVKT